MAVGISGVTAAVKGLVANPAMVAPPSWRPSRARKAARIANGERIMTTLPESWILRIAREHTDRSRHVPQRRGPRSSRSTPLSTHRSVHRRPW
jgi:hypothetical protein